MEHNFNGPSFTIGIEEELMIVDEETFNLVNAIESLIGDHDAGEIKPELMESVLEIATKPAASTVEAGRQLRTLRGQVRETAGHRGLTIGSAGTHPFAMWEDQRISARQRYRDLVSSLRFVARQELIFGMHVHVGIDDPDTAIHVANGMRVHLAVLLALSANSPFWRAQATGLLSARTPIFRQFPRVGIPPAWDDWAHYEREIAFMVQSGVMEDYTYLWYDVRPHPSLGTVEIRICDSQTRVEHTLGLTALIQAMVRELAEHHASGSAPWPRRRARRPAVERPGRDEGARPPSARPSARPRARPRLRGRLRRRPGSARPRQRRGAPDRRVRGQPRPARGHGRDRGGDRCLGSPPA
jgi:carboxylate-amine ligase